ncbi:MULTISPECIES: hypothetical protein [Staphylococcus]|uniref:Uncharacterized protein n=2 Tax=Staphylococcus pettenkoferi TaxID=170573 RepID=A0A2N6QD38_9STAP|nr:MULTISPECIES: hypothetical protein [Staphylococcus]MCI2791722.1 hypothetical protein [Staphylococcus pettenkoferi]OFK76919.1 hypothetical protein HMPREF2802_09540 [Staphylococcus sp. HMSC071G07]PMC17456.1 hypothetical protein CJ235_10610 [Staphylococcus pettenkoferi]
MLDFTKMTEKEALDLYDYFDIQERDKFPMELAKYMHEEGFKTLYNELNEAGQKKIEDLVKEGNQLTIIPIQEGNNIRLLIGFNILQHYSVDEYYISPSDLNLFNEQVFDNKYPEINDLSYEQDIQVRKHQMIYETRVELEQMLFYEHLVEHFTVDDLKDICRTYAIKGFSQKNKKQLAEMIHKRIMTDNEFLYNILVELDSKNDNYKDTMIGQMRNSLQDVVNPYPLEEIIFYHHPFMNILVIPFDLYERIIQFEDEWFETMADEFFDEMDEDDEDEMTDEDYFIENQALIKSLKADPEMANSKKGQELLQMFDALNNGDEEALKQLLESDDSLFEDEPSMEDDIAHYFCHLAVWFYGIVSTQHLAKLWKKYFNDKMSAKEIELECRRVLDNRYIIKNHYVIHPLYRNNVGEEMLEISNLVKDYYVPESLDAMYDEIVYESDAEENPHVKNLKNTLKRYYKGSAVLDTDDLLQEMVAMLKLIPDEKSIDYMVKDITENPELKFKNGASQAFIKALQQVSPHVHVWLFKGHTRRELEEAAKHKSNVIQFDKFRK